MPFPAIFGKDTWLELGENMRHMGNFLEVLNCKKAQKNTLTMCMIYIVYYERVISYKCNHLYWGCNVTSCSVSTNVNISPHIANTEPIRYSVKAALEPVIGLIKWLRPKGLKVCSYVEKCAEFKKSNF